MKDPRVLALVLGVLALAAVVGVRLAGGSSDEPASTTGGAELTIADDDPERYLRGSSVGDGLGAAPPIAEPVQAAARAAGCTVRSFPSAVPRPADPQPGFLHEPDRVTDQSTPPTNGYHDDLWADYGVYDEAVPYRYQVHDLEHGAVIVHLGRRVDDAGWDRLRTLWASSPPYLLVVPETAPSVPESGLALTSWQRFMACPDVGEKALDAVRAYRDAYRGTGPENAPARDVPERFKTPELPDPTIADPGARS